MRLLSLSETSIQPRTSLPKFSKILENLVNNCKHLPKSGYPGRRGARAGEHAARPKVAGGARDQLRSPEPPADFWQTLANFARLVFGCIDVSDSESRRIFQDFSKNLQDLHSFAPRQT